MKISNRKVDEELYSLVAQELEDGSPHKGLWLKAIQLAGGNKDKQASEYIKLRVQSVKDDISIFSEWIKSQQNKNSFDLKKFIALLTKNSSFDEIINYMDNVDIQSIKELINTPDNFNKYPLHICVRQNRADLVILLLKFGAKTNLINFSGKKPSEIALENNNKEIVDILSQYP